MLRSGRLSRVLAGRQLLLPGFELAPARSVAGEVVKGFYVAVIIEQFFYTQPQKPPTPSGSVAMIFTPAFEKAVNSGSCPVSLVLASLPRWCVRSALLSVLCIAGKAGAFGAGIDRANFEPVLKDFLGVALVALNIDMSLSLSEISKSLTEISFLARVPAPAWSLKKGVRFELYNIRSAFMRLSSSLAWQLKNRGGCPDGVRSLLACLCLWVICALKKLSHNVI